MAEPTQLIYTDNPGTLSATYTLPPGLDLRVESVVARINGAAAAASFLPALSIYSSDDKLMARVPADTTYAVGDTGVVTWSPFLRAQATSTAFVTGHPFAIVNRNANQSIPSGGGFTEIIWDAAPTNEQSIWSAGDPTKLFAPVSGLYTLFLWAKWDGNTTGDRGAGMKGSDGVQIAFVYGPAPTSGGSNQTVATQNHKMTAGDYIKFEVSQNSGANRNLTAIANFGRYGTYT